MRQVFVVFTEHDESGATNSSNLLAILADIEPDVVYLECPPAFFDDYLDGKHAKLEPLAIARYREIRAVELVPVDLSVPQGADLARMPELLNKVARVELDYDRYASWHRSYVYAHGFSYLNSKYCSDLAAKRHDLIVRATTALSDQALTSCYAAWVRIHNQREEAMISNIENHSRSSSFKRAVFLIGSGHRQSIVDRTGKASKFVNWNFLVAQEHTDRGGAA